MGLACAHTSATDVFEFVFTSEMAIGQMFETSARQWVPEKESRCVHLDHGYNLHS